MSHQIHWIATFINSLHFCFTTDSCCLYHTPIHLISFTISNYLHWIHLGLDCSQVAHISIWSTGSPFFQLAGSLVHHHLHSFCGWSSGNSETKIQECAKKNNTWNRKLKTNTLNFLENNPRQFHWIVTFTNSLHFCFTTVSCWLYHTPIHLGSWIISPYKS